MNYLEILEEAGLDYSASDEEILAVDGIGPATLEKIREEAPKEKVVEKKRKVIATRSLLIKEGDKKMSVNPGDELPDWDLVDELIKKRQAKVV